MIYVALGLGLGLGGTSSLAQPSGDAVSGATATASAPATRPADTAPSPAAASSASVGTVTGHALDGDTQVGLAAATVQVLDAAGAAPEAITELDGAYTLTLAAGTYTIAFSTADHVTERRTITLAGSQTLTLDVSLTTAPKAGVPETIEVYGVVDDRKDAAVLAQRRSSATVSDAISAQQISRSPDSNASDAAKRMVAATIQDNRYIVIRGLGGRYSTTLLNGVPLPSPDPDVPAAPLDLFPSALITNLTVNKTFSPDMPGNFAGGALGIETRVYPTRLVFKARAGLAGNSASTFRTLNGQSGGSLDMLGYDDGARALPGAIDGDTRAGVDTLSPEQRNAQIAGFKNNWTIDRNMVGPNLSLGATLGDTLKLSDQRLGYFGSVSFSHGYSSRLAHIARVGSDDGDGGRIPSVLQLDDRQGIEQANLGALASAGFTPAPHHKLDLFALYAHTADITSSEVTGTESSGAVVDRTRLSFVQRELLFTQLVGDDRLADRVSLEWQANVARVGQREPDTRDLLRTQTPDGRYAISGGVGGAERLFGDLVDNTLGGAAALRIPLGEVKLKTGASIQRSARDYQVRRFHFNLTGDTAFLSPEQAFDPRNAGTGMLLDEATDARTDGYTATRMISAGFAMADVSPTSRLRLIAGARFERSSLDIGVTSKVDPMTSAKRTRRDDNDILPSLNVVYAISPATNLRAAYTMTVARPNFREVAPALYYDYIRRRAIGGTPDLLETNIQNGDLRWETFLGDSEVVAASVFAKHFTQPIERTVESAGDGDNISFNNKPTANSYGLELEARLSLGRISAALAPFSIGANFSWIGSRVVVGGGVRRALQGQSPYVANVGLGYESQAIGTRLDLAYNSFGRRIEEVGTAGAGDIYEEPFHRLDLTLSQPLPRNLRLKLAATNLLDQRVVRTQNDVEIFAYDVGVTVLGSVEYSLE